MAESKSKDDSEVFDLERLKNLVQLMEEHGLTELDLRHEKQRIKLCRGVSHSIVDPSALPKALPAVGLTQREATPGPIVDKGQRTDDGEHIVLIKSPMVGTFYSRPNPEAKPFVQVGDVVSPDQTVCIIEAMKVFNPIPAEISGTVVARLADDEEPVDFGKPLFKVDTSK